MERDEPIAVVFAERAAPEGLAPIRAVRFEYTSRGDRVTGRLLLPPEPNGRRPLALVGHGAGGSKDAPYLDAAVGPWVRAGAAVASIDFPLHGERASAKLSARIAKPPQGEADRLLREEFLRQSALDLGAARAALAARAGAERFACVACEPSAWAAEAFAASDAGVSVVTAEPGAGAAEVVARLRRALAR
jgi:hypothetical protein